MHLSLIQKQIWEKKAAGRTYNEILNNFPFVKHNHSISTLNKVANCKICHLICIRRGYPFNSFKKIECPESAYHRKFVH